MNTAVVNHLAVLLRNGNFREGNAIDALDVVGAEQVHVLVVTREFERNIGDYNAQRQGLDADLFVSVLTLRVEELHDVRVVCAEVNGTRPLTRTQLVRVREGVLQKLHDRDNATGLVLDLLNRSAGFTQVRQRQGDATTALRQLKSRVNATGDRLHIVFDT